MRGGERRERTVVALAVAMTAGWYITFVALGAINGDEGAYLNYGRLVARGELPYRDFAFPQMPLLSYVHALPQTIVGPSLLAGRITSAVIGVIAVGLAIDAARRIGGTRAAAFAAVLLSTSTFAAYMHSITKTHPVTSLFLVGSVWTLTLPWSRRTTVPLSAASASLATLNRLSSVVFAAAIALYGVSQPATRRRTLIACGAVAAVALAFLGTDLHGARFGLRDFHLGQWEAQGAERVRDILIERIPRVLIVFGPHAAVGAYAFHRARDGATRNETVPFRLFAAASAVFVIVHLLTGQWHDEYLVPAIYLGVPLVAALLARIDLRAATRVTAIVALLAIGGGLRFIDLSGGELPLVEAHRVGEAVGRHSEPGDEVFALSALWAAVDADREVPRGFEIIHNGLREGSEQEAKRLHLLTPSMLVDLVAGGEVSVVAVSWLDHSAIRRVGGRDELERFERALGARYDLVARFADTGQSRGEVKIYALRRPTVERAR